MEPVGIVLEYRNQLKRLRISYCHVAKVTGEIGIPKLTKVEIAIGQTTVWMLPQMALDQIKSDRAHVYAEHFILQRETVFLEAFLRSGSNL